AVASWREHAENRTHARSFQLTRDTEIYSVCSSGNDAHRSYLCDRANVTRANFQGRGQPTSHGKLTAVSCPAVRQDQERTLRAGGCETGRSRERETEED